MSAFILHGTAAVTNQNALGKTDVKYDWLHITCTEIRLITAAVIVAVNQTKRRMKLKIGSTIQVTLIQVLSEKFYNEDSTSEVPKPGEKKLRQLMKNSIFGETLTVNDQKMGRANLTERNY
uniref:Uncharacterized protein n=1 Tax=Romanomermis culicivorax TaxID=13658 RepID=A0A915KXX9_ROMCU